jgi:aminoglycoside phosphotransferase (APT) family kinase protein
MAVWSPEEVVDEQRARRLIDAQFPEVALDSLELLGEGWDNTVWLVDGRWVFRFPRREIAVPAVERQVALLPVLAPLLPLPTSVPAYTGVPSDEFRWPFTGCALVPGREVHVVAPDDDARAALARPLAQFLQALHTAHVEAAESLPVDANDRADMTKRARLAAEQLDEVQQLGVWRRPPVVDEVLADSLHLRPAEGRVIAHGDLHFRHLLLDDGGAAAGVIDWDDICIADPCIDLMLVWCLLPPSGRAAFLDEYGPATDDQLLRARVIALSVCAAIAAYAASMGHRALLEEAVASLDRTAAA